MAVQCADCKYFKRNTSSWGSCEKICEVLPTQEESLGVPINWYCPEFQDCDSIDDDKPPFVDGDLDKYRGISL